jgi:hypothetical protein
MHSILVIWEQMKTLTTVEPFALCQCDVATGKSGKETRFYGTLQDLFQRPTVDERRVVATRVEETDEEDEEVVVIQDSVAGGSLGAAIFGIIKGTVGPAILYLPHGFLHSGYAVAIPSMLFATSMFIYNSYRLLACWKVESTKQHEMAQHIEQVLGLTTIQETKYTPTLLTYPELARRALGRGAFFVELGIALMQFGVCLTYLIFVPQNLYECTRALSGGHYTCFPNKYSCGS